MTTYFLCNKCSEVTAEADMVSFDVRPKADRTVHFLACPCGEDEDLEEVSECAACYDHAQLVDGTDLCDPCWREKNPDTGPAEAARKERRYDPSESWLMKHPG